MKVRIMGNTLRMRLSQSEIAELGKGGRVSDVTVFPGHKELKYEIKGSAADSISCNYGDDTISVVIPQPLVSQWVNTDMVGLNHGIPVNKSSKLSILVEKDFMCRTERPGEDETDLYPNPLKSH
jgi:hypothetical protein